jgi:serine protease Do
MPHVSARRRIGCLAASIPEASMRFGRHFSPRSSLRCTLTGVAAALMLLSAPPLADAQAGTAQNGGTEKNLTAQVQNEVTVNLPSLNPLVQRVQPAVVNISAQLSSEAAAGTDRSADESEGSSSPFDDFLHKFFENRGLPHAGREVMALGSGFVIDPSGLIVTNNHVVGNADKITVILQDNSRHPAKIIGRDEKTDLALLQIDAGGKKLPFVGWGDSDNSKVGDWVMAVGNPFGLGGTVTAGIVSALGRNINEGPYDDFIQIDAPINRGNSGGPTFNLHGEVIGINTAIYSPSGGSVGIGFALPSNTAKNVIQQLREHGHVTRGWLGVAIQTITPTIAKSLGMDPDQPAGALVASVTPNSPAVKAGIKPGDVILSAEGQPIKTVHDLPRLVANTPIGKKIDLQVRRGGKDMTLSATIGELQETQQAAAAADNTRPEKTSSLGLQLSSIDPAVRRQFRIPKEVEGAVVAEVAPDSPAAALGIEPGDVIESVDQQPVKTPQQAAEALQQASSKGNILLLLNRHGTSQFVGLTVTPNTGPNSGSSGNPG